MPVSQEVKEDPKAQEAMKDFARLRTADACMETVGEGNEKIEMVAEDLFYVVARKTLQMMGSLSKYVSYMGSTMAVVRTGDTLTVFNSHRLKDEDMKALDALGKVKNIVRLGCFHGSSDPYYLDRYKDAEYWVLEGMELHEGLGKEPKYLKEGSMPIEGMKVFVVPGAKLPEGMAYLPSSGGTLISCDCLQNNTQMLPAQTSYIMALFMALQGFRGKARIGPGFVQFGYTAWGVDAKPLLTEFFNEQVFKEKISFLIPGHGVPLSDDIIGCIKTSLDKL